MAYIRHKDSRKIPQEYLKDPESGALLLEIKKGFNEKVKKTVPTLNFRGKLVSIPRKANG